MRVSYNWLRELLPGLDAPPAEVAERLTRAGLEVESLDTIGAGLDRVVLATVEKVEPHPKREKLQLVTVNHGDGRQRVVCGAANVPGSGGKVVLARVGTTLPAIGVTLTTRDIGGVPSEGMLLSEVEMGLGADSDGILVLPSEAGEPGTLLPTALPEAMDTIYDIGVTPNRPDALGHVGVARDVAALFELEFEKLPVEKPKRVADAKLEDLISVTIEDGDRCPLYAAAAVLDVEIRQSPTWLRWRLHSLGVRPINNVVDITNLLLFEFGQPMHAFDLDLVRGSKIVVRRARPEERLRTLDGVDRKLDADDLVICDGDGPTALAGVMGGETSEIRETTKRVLLECAYFTPRGVRRTGRRHGLHTESSFRFERGTDWGGVSRVLDRAKTLLSSLASGAEVPGALRVEGDALTVPTMTLRSKRLDALVGVEIPFDEACASLTRLGLSVKRNGGTAEITGASWRPDIGREVDLIEEVARLRGLDEIPTLLPATPPPAPRTTGRLERRAAEIAVSLGLSETVTYSFVSERELEAVRAPKSTVHLANPLSEERSRMRTSLLPGLLETLRRARRRGEKSVGLFATGARFLPPRAKRGSDALAARPPLPEDERLLPYEHLSFAAALGGPRRAHLEKPTDVDAFDAKGVAVELIERLTGRTSSVGHATGEGTSHLHPRAAGEVRIEDERVGLFGPLHPDVVDALDLDGPAMIVEVDLEAVERLGRPRVAFRPIPRLPAVTRDLALVVSDDVSAGDVGRAIAKSGGKLCESVELFDLFRGGSIPDGHRSLAFHVVYRDPKAATDPDDARTLTDKEVDSQHASVVRAVNEEFGATLRK